MPESGIDCGLPGALSVAVKLAWRGPVAVGVKTTLTVQVALGASTVGKVQFGVAAKSPGLAPASATEFTLSPWFPVFVSVTNCELLGCPTVTLPKLTEDGNSAATGPLAA